MAASFALLCFGSWKLSGFMAPVPSEESVLPVDGWKAVRGEARTRVELQFSVERNGLSGMSIEPGRVGQTYGPDDALVLRVDLRGEPSWVSLFEQMPGRAPVRIHPREGAGWQVQPGLHALSSPSGKPLAYRPDRPSTGIRYFALASSNSVDAERLLGSVLDAGLDRPDLWPRPVRSVDSFVVDWIE